ncbi:centrin-1 isoform X2 [Pistacia vera]|uniref:centrin-1 isoform X2 n=1 Tax=Pistacia vera TaxID=55513 RepID=UPI001263D6AD|nr:centrin-1 isoform X2 [Pistacia vera]
MVRAHPLDSEAEETESSSSEEEIGEPNRNGQKQPEVSEYEKRRLSRIAENKARMEALGLSKLASSFMGSSQNSNKRKGKRKVVEDDEDYMPNDDGDDDDDDDGANELDDDKSSRSNKRKVKSKSPKSKKKTSQKQLNSADYIDEDTELMQAIALSLQHSAEVPGSTLNEKKGQARAQEDTGRGKRKKSFTSRVQMTEDEVILHFFQFDESGRGIISKRDLRRVAVAHDFLWTDEELADMVHCFDSDGDGKLNLDDFRKIVSRCNMIQASDNS